MIEPNPEIARRLAQFREIHDHAVARHGADSPVVKFLADEIPRIEAELAASALPVPPAHIPRTAAAAFEQGMVLYVVLGAMLIIALMGFSSLMLAMLAAKWGSG